MMEGMRWVEAPPARVAADRPAAARPGVLHGGLRVQRMLQQRRRLDARPASGPNAVLGAALQRQAHTRLHPRPVLASTPTARSTGGVVQGVFTYGAGLQPPQTDLKRSDLHTLLQTVASPQMATLRGAPNVDVHFALDDQNDFNPGDTRLDFQNLTGAWQHMGHALPGVQYPQARVRVHVRNWFVDRYDLGTVVSMFMHELGAHALPYTDTLVAMTGAAGATAPELAAMSGTGERAEHLNTQDPAEPAYAGYRQVMQDSAGTLAAMGLPADATSALEGYLMDLASLDNAGRRIRFPTQPRAMALNRNMFRAWNPWMDAHGVADNIGTTDVVKHYAGFYAAGLPTGLRMAAERHPYLATAAGAGLLATLWGTGALGWLASKLGIGMGVEG
jgi:hypothetical protein